jgi:hypothetical protein
MTASNAIKEAYAEACWMRRYGATESCMPDYDIPADIRAFISRYIDSIAHLEALLLLRGNSDRSWSDFAVAKRLYISKDEASNILESLASAGFMVHREDGYRFECKTQDLENLVERLAVLYRQQLIPVTGLIHSQQRHLHEFANAFRWRKDS